jgi:tetratricopeptide (TPR) repeat protein
VDVLEQHSIIPVPTGRIEEHIHKENNNMRNVMKKMLLCAVFVVMPMIAAFAQSGTGDADQDIAKYTKMIQRNPNDTAVYLNRGNAYFGKGDYDRAIADYTQALRLDLNDAMAYSGRGNAYFNKRDYDRAIADYTQALRLDPNDATAYSGRGLAYYYRGDYDRFGGLLRKK